MIYQGCFLPFAYPIIFCTSSCAKCMLDLRSLPEPGLYLTHAPVFQGTDCWWDQFGGSWKPIQLQRVFRGKFAQWNILFVGIIKKVSGTAIMTVKDVSISESRQNGQLRIEIRHNSKLSVGISVSRPIWLFLDIRRTYTWIPFLLSWSVWHCPHC